MITSNARSRRKGGRKGVPRVRLKSDPFPAPLTRSRGAFSGAPRYRGPKSAKNPQEAAKRTGETPVKRVQSRGVDQSVTKTPKRGAGAASFKKLKTRLSEWYVVRVRNGMERYATREVQRQGHRVFVPYELHEGQNREQPLFPGHIFILGPQWYFIKTTPGCLAPIMMGDAPAKMPIVAMRSLLRDRDKDGVRVLASEKFTKGQAVTIRRGAWQGHTGLYIREVERRRVRLLLSLLGGKHELEFNHFDITAADIGGSGLKADGAAPLVDGAASAHRGNK